MDLATALDLSLEDQQEAKFLALRTLHGKKIKQLMLSIETKEKEVAKLKLLSKDSRRTQMIQALRNKIKDMELTMDVMKEEIGKVRESPKSKEEVNDFVIRKTVGGPKRFRPLTREEMENKILELEKKLSKAGKGGGGSVSGGPSISSQARSIAGARDALTSIAGRQGIKMSEVPESGANGNNNIKGIGGEGDGGGGLSKIAQLMEEINGLRSALDVSEGNCELQKEEVSRLRKRNSELAAEAEEVSYYKMQYLEMEASKDDVMEEVLMVQRRLAELTEENNVLETNSSTELELAQAELDTLQSQCEKLLNQNASLLKKLGDLEEELDDAHHQAGMASVATKQAGSASAQSALVTAETERKLSRLQDKLKQSELLIASLQQDNQQITLLKSQLREKNNIIKKQSQQLGEVRTSRDNSRSPVRAAAATSAAASASAAETEEILAQLKSKLHDTEIENERLGNALSAATRRLNSPERRIAGPDVGPSAAVVNSKEGPVSPRDKDQSKIKGLQTKLREAESEIDHLNGALSDEKAAHASTRTQIQGMKDAVETAANAQKHAESDLADANKALKKEKKKVAAMSPTKGKEGDNDLDDAFYSIGEVSRAVAERQEVVIQHYVTVFDTAMADGKLARKITSKAPPPNSLSPAAIEATLAMIVNQRPPEDEDQQDMHELNVRAEKSLLLLTGMLRDLHSAEGGHVATGGGSPRSPGGGSTPLLKSRQGSPRA